ncbi:MAG: glycosyltransferase family 4 protein [Anaerolineae bacterium]|nr:glycosyltransferase family 4 protein [Anaerolineae bacterium]
MRIGIDARLVYYRPGGIAEYTRHVIQQLADLDRTTPYYVLHHRDQDTLARGENFRRINAVTPCHHRLERWSLSVELARFRLDLLHSPDMIPPGRGARRHVITVHDLNFLHYPQFMTAASLRYYNDQITWAVRHADHILVDSEATRDDLGNLLGVPAGNMTVHMLGVNEAFHPLPDADVVACRERLGLPESYILFVGTFEPRKNIPGLLDAYARLRQDSANIPPLVMVGRRGWLYGDIFARVEDLNLARHVIWLENVPEADLPAIYNGAAVLVLPSHYEGFGLPALEAMACGTPSVVANRSSLPEVIGEAGVLVDPDDTDDLAHAIQRLLGDAALYERLRTAGLARAATFTWHKTASVVLQVYRNVLSS